MGGEGHRVNDNQQTTDQINKPSLEDRALKYIESHNKQIWLGIAILALVVVLIKRSA